MVIQNLTPNYYILAENMELPPSGIAEISNSWYRGSAPLQGQIDQLFLKGIISVNDYPEGFPFSVEEEEEKLPDSFDYGRRDFVIFIDKDGLHSSAALSVDVNVDDINYGAVKLQSETGSEAGLYSYETGKKDGMVYAYKNQNENQKHFDIRTDGFRATLNASSITAGDIALFLIDLGLADAT